MKQFNLGEYLKNPELKVVTRDGRLVRILCTDVKSKPSLPIIALVYDAESDTEICQYYHTDGTLVSGAEYPVDLFFASTKHKRWQNIYKNYGGGYYSGDIYSTEEEAKKVVEAGRKDYIATIKIEWEE